MTPKLSLAGLLISFIILLPGCTTSRPVESSIPVKFFASGEGKSEELIIFLPGQGDDIQAFERAGFIEILQRSRRSADAVVMDAHLGYYLDGSLAEHVYREILLPCGQNGYRRFIIVGVSIGGYGALWIRHEYAEWISAVVLLAPYLGKKALIANIEASGGIHQWRSQTQSPGWDEKAWVWIDDMSGNGSRVIESAILAIGRNDKFRQAAELLATTLPAANVFRNNGRHNWPTWQLLWSDVTESHSWEILGYTGQ